jgi:putative nucleotidyltransferase with HDIG domain
MPTSLGPGLARQANPRVNVARSLAAMLLAELPERWSHTVAVARRAHELAATVEAEQRDVLLVAAWLHDIGYGPEVVCTGFHPLDGASYLDRHGWPPRVAGLVAHHSGAHLVAPEHGLVAALNRYPREESPVSDALAYADQTVGPAGLRLPIRARMSEMLRRHGPGSAQAKAHHLRGPFLLAAAERVERRLRDID